MKKKDSIKVFLASSEELDYDRQALGNLVRKLNNNDYNRRGIHIDLFEWEDSDAAYNGVPKQAEYDEKVRESDMFLALFYIKAGEFTIHEFNVAIEELLRNEHKLPKVYVYCKDLQPGEIQSPELTEFKRRLDKDLGHYWVRYGNRDTMLLNFVLQLQIVEKDNIDRLKIQNGEITFNGVMVSRMDRLPFAVGNEEYKRMSKRLVLLQKEIEDARILADKYPSETTLQEKLQNLKNEQNELQNEFEQQQRFLLNTAIYIAQLQENVITDRMRRAMEAFETGDVHKATILLAEAENDAQRNLDAYKLSKEMVEQDRKKVISSISELLLKASTIMADSSIGNIEERVARAIELYEQADETAQEVNYDKEKYHLMLFGYARLLQDFAHYKEAIQIYKRQITMVDEFLGINNPVSAISYNNIASIYNVTGKYDEALAYYSKALIIYEMTVGPDDADVSGIYNNIGSVCFNRGDYTNALQYYFKALGAMERVLGPNHSNTAACYNNIGQVYFAQGDYAKALDYYTKALDIVEKVLGEHQNTASIFGNIGRLYFETGNYDQALAFFLNALKIREKVLGKDQPGTSASFSDLGMVYHSKGDLNNALKYYKMALDVCLRVYGEKHPDVATDYGNIGSVYNDQGEYDKALEYHLKALEILEENMAGHPMTAVCYSKLGSVYIHKGNFSKALECNFKALDIQERLLGVNHHDTAVTYSNIGSAYFLQGDYSKASEYFIKSMNACERLLGKTHPFTIESYKNLAISYYRLGECIKSLEYYKKILEVFVVQLGERDPKTIAMKRVVDYIEIFESMQ